MSTPGGHRAGMAIVRIELERAGDPGRPLLRVSTVDDVTRPGSTAEGKAMSDADAAIEYLRTWIDAWTRGA